MSGTVHLVGAGPGDPGLLTLRGADVLRRADVVLWPGDPIEDIGAVLKPALVMKAGDRVYDGASSS